MGDNIKMGIGTNEIGCEGADWIHMAQDRGKANTQINFPVSSKAGNFFTR
jgi:hypothetical protein